MNHYGYIICFLLFSTLSKGQQWSISNVNNEIFKDRNISPEKYLTVKLDDIRMKQLLWQAPKENLNKNFRGGSIINIITSDGKMDSFSVFEYEMMEDKLASNFSEFRTFIGRSNSDPYRSVRIDYTSKGFRAVISDLSGKTYIDPSSDENVQSRIVYRKEDMETFEEWSCISRSGNVPIGETDRFVGDCMFRTYRLAVAATGEYTAFHGGTVNGGMAAIVTAINRVNQIYEQDLGVRLILVNNNNLLVYTNPSTDPYNNTNGSNMLGQNQSNVDNVIGSSNYDVGHVFSTGGGGIAYLGVICNNNLKAGGVTGLGSPTGDAFYVDYVAHEIGHQFGANHTFYAETSNCGVGNRNIGTAFEPGSGSTIMAYAGICGSTNNLQSNSDAYFHAASLAEIAATLNSTSCAVETNFNSQPTIVALNDYTVPKSTPLVLDGFASDPDFDPLTYCWEQFDNQAGFASPPVSTSTGGPMFRSVFHSSDSKRYLPSLDNIINATNDTWEVLPSVSRVLNFRLTVRDHSLVPGCTAEDNMTVNVSAASGPFIVTSQNSSISYFEGQSVPITWNVAGTTAAPVSCANVDILYSTDGGQTYPISILANTANDGAQNILIPIGATSSARIMVKCSNNIFFDINNADFTVTAGSPTFTIENSPSFSDICNSESSVQFIVNTTSVQGFSDPINLSVSGLPPGVNSNFSSSTITPGQSSTVTLSNFGNNTGTSNIVINGISGAINKTTSYALNLFSTLVSPSLIAPLNNEIDVNSLPNLSWNPVSGANSYYYEISIGPNGFGVVESGNTTNTSVNISTSLDPLTSYFWRVRAINICGNSSWSTNRTFQTSNCVVFSSTDVPKLISSSGRPTILSTLTVPIYGTLNDLNIVNLAGTHSYIRDLRFSLIGPDNTTIIFMNRVCDSENDFDINFDDEASNSTIPCPPIGGGTYQPEVALSAFIGKEVNGTWTLKVEDRQNGDGGSLNSWGLEMCYSSACDLTVNSTLASGPGSLTDAIECASSGETITLSSSLANMTISLGSSSLFIDKNISIIGNAADNITITSSGTNPSLRLLAGNMLTLEGFTLGTSSTSRETLLNEGSLTLHNMNIINSNANDHIVNSTNSEITIVGYCNLIE